MTVSVPVAGVVAQSSVPLEQGSLRDWLTAINYGDKNADQWVEPTTTQWQQFATLLDDFYQHKFDAVIASANALGLTLKRFESNDTSTPIEYLVLTEVAQPTAAQFIGFGTYVMKTHGVGLAIGAPHPKSDLYTGTQAIDAFINTGARYLMLPGVRRDNHTSLSPCTGSDYRISDASHYDRQVFYLAHERLNRIKPQIIFVQLHGFGSSSLAKLQTQCQSSMDKIVIISEGVARHASSPETLSSTLNRKLNDAGVIRSCLFGVDANLLGATRTTVGRLVNGSGNSCQQSADKSSGRFVHIEQSYDVRRNHRDALINTLDAAIADWLPESANNH